MSIPCTCNVESRAYCAPPVLANTYIALLELRNTPLEILSYNSIACSHQISNSYA